MELKRGQFTFNPVKVVPFNRTTMELKQIEAFCFIGDAVSFNRTTMELKRIYKTFYNSF